MVTLTEKAVEKVRDFIAEQNDEETFQGIRISVIGGGCSGFQYAMRLESESNGDDSVFEANGFKVFVDQQSIQFLDGTEVDFVDTPQGSGFKFNNPNVRGTCGCGESFQV
jgi:iron-sulfur cluster assembly protein